MATATEPRHPIGVVSDRTGLTPDVLRVWERRYGVVNPGRSSGGQRTYSDSDIDRLILLRRATQGGHSISHVAGLSRPKLEELVRDVESANDFSEVRFSSPRQLHAAIDQALGFTNALDPSGLETLLRRHVLRYGIVTFIDALAAPFLREVGEAWHDKRLSVSQEHLATAVVQRVVSETAPLLTGGMGNPAIVIATLEGERHANGALMAAAVAASEGWWVIYLGADLPAKEIADATVRTRARVTGISMVLPEKKSQFASALRELDHALPDETTLLVGGAGSRGFQMSLRGRKVVFIEAMSELHAVLGSIR